MTDLRIPFPLSVRFSERCCGDPDLLKVEVFDLRCPSHGLAATLRECVTADRSAR